MIADADGTDNESLSAPSGTTSGNRAAQVAAWGFAFVLLRVFAVSAYDWDTAYLVSTTLGLDDGPALLFGSLMGNALLTAILLVAVLPLLFAAAWFSGSGHRRLLMLLSVVGVVVLIALTVSFTWWWVPLATVAIFGTLLVIDRLPRANRLRRMAGAVIARVGLVVAVAALLMAAFGQTPWVPHEQIKTAEGTITGYVLSVDSGYLNVLNDDHEFVIVRSTDVISRE